MSDQNRPMKGFHGMFNQELLEHFGKALDDLTEVYDDEAADESPGEILAGLEERGWHKEKDKFGDKRYITTSYPASSPPLSTDELRISVILRKGALYFDLRPWGQY